MIIVTKTIQTIDYSQNSVKKKWNNWIYYLNVLWIPFQLHIQSGKMGIFIVGSLGFEPNLDSSPIVNPTLELHAFLESLELHSSKLNSPSLVVWKGLVLHHTQNP